MKNRSSRRSAFSLLEVLFGVLLAGTCAAILAATMPVATNSRIKADFNNKATSLAQKELEEIRGKGYANLTANSLLNYGLIDSATALKIEGQDAGITSYSFTNVDSGVSDNPARLLPEGIGIVSLEQVDTDLRRVTVEVSWTDRGRERFVRVATLLANL